jgi:hypothetical protein
MVLSGILDFAGVQGGLNIFTKIRDSFTSLKNFFDLVAVSAAPIVAGIATYKAGIKTVASNPIRLCAKAPSSPRQLTYCSLRRLPNDC